MPIARRYSYEVVRRFAGSVTRGLAVTSDGLVTLERVRTKRHGVYVDTKMNGHGQQIVGPYSLRPLPAAAVATPLRWEEVDERLDPAKLGLEAVLQRVGREGDAAAPLLHGRQRLGDALRALSDSRISIASSA